MGAVLPVLLATTLLSLYVVIAWMVAGPGPRPARLIIGSAFLAALAASWGMLIFGSSHEMARDGAELGLMTCFVSWAVPVLWRRFMHLPKRQH